MERIAIMWLLALVAGVAVGEEKAVEPFTIRPYLVADMWVFDDPSVGLEKEPFFTGVPRIFEAMTADIAEAEKGFRLLFAERTFAGSSYVFLRREPDQGGTWYEWEGKGLRGWLCPALLKYFEAPPARLHVGVAPLEKTAAPAKE